MQAVWRIASERSSRCCALAALLLLLAALITPWGLATSHGAAALSAAVHGASWSNADSHGHSHVDEVASAATAHPHHGSDHSHDTAHALPLALMALGQTVPRWTDWSAGTPPVPDLAGLERPPKG